MHDRTLLLGQSTVLSAPSDVTSKLMSELTTMFPNVKRGMLTKDQLGPADKQLMHM